MTFDSDGGVICYSSRGQTLITFPWLVGEDAAFLGSQFWSLQVALCPLRLSSIK